ncbi:MAG: AAA family ATPase [Treponema sp.]|jgi:predicted ATPase|nr:AAA family ATPase [Treponema sp.]
MITRLYIDNFRTLVNFEIRFEAINLLLGANGSGKSSVFDVLRRLRGFIGGETRLAETFPSADFTRWQTKPLQKFEIEVDTDDGVFIYTLVIEFFDDLTKSKVKEEKLTLKEKPAPSESLLFYSKEGEAHLHNDQGHEGPVVSFDWTQSGVGLLQERRDNKKLTAFKKYIENITVVRPTPVLMESESQHEEKQLSLCMENFAAWYRYLTLENPSACREIFDELPGSVPGFFTLKSAEAGERRLLKADFQTSDISAKHTYLFASLSDGQKMLIAIYALILGNKERNACIFIDEPDNYISIEEIQPWLRLFVDDCGRGERLEQVVLISHHPEVIDYSCLGVPIWFEREQESHTRIRPIEQEEKGYDGPVLTLSQSIARKLVK